jgi:hypothetical protein
MEIYNSFDCEKTFSLTLCVFVCVCVYATDMIDMIVY